MFVINVGNQFVFSLMYWTNVFPRAPSIESAWMTGDNRTVLISERLGNPTGLTIDHYMAGRVYWCDSKENIIESMNPDGTDRAVVIMGGELSLQEPSKHETYSQCWLDVGSA